jgi:O-antigen/teichoic acid export membrane protein
MRNKENIFFGFFSIIIFFISVLNVQLLSNYYSIEEFGRYQFLMTLVGVFSIASLTGYDTFSRKHMISGDDRYFFYMYKKVLPYSVIVLALIGAGIAISDLEYKKLLLVAIAIAVMVVFDKLSSVFSAKLMFKKLRYADIIGKSLFLALTYYSITFNLSFEEYIYMLFFIYIFNHFARILISVVYIDKNNVVLNEFELHDFNKGAIKNTLVVGYATFASWIERLILGWISPVQLGVFSIGYLIPKLIKDNAKSFLTPMFFKWSKDGFDMQYILIDKYKRLLLMVGVFFFLAVLFGVEIIIDLFFEKYHESILISQILAVTLVPIFVIYAKAHAMLMSKHIDKNNKVEITSNTVKIILSAIAIPLFEIWGAVASVLVSEFVRLWFYYKSFAAIINKIS